MKFEDVKKAFRYKGGKLFWRKTGKRACTKMSDQPYRVVWFGGKLRKEHRIIFLLMNKYLPKVVDHVKDDLNEEGIKSNFAVNLQEATQSLNIQKQSRKVKNKSGYRGVHWHGVTGKWDSAIRSNGKLIHLGLFEDPKEAAHASGTCLR